jgi:hypothetical protein
MSMIPTTGIIGSLAATPLAQSKGADIDRAQHDTANQKRETTAAEKADMAAGIGRTEEDSQADDRDADGRRPWELPAKYADESSAADDAAASSHRGKDPTGERGQQLDISG